MTGPTPGGPGDTLIATAVDAEVEPLTNFEGAGVASSWSDLAKAVNAQDPDALQILSTAAGAGLDTLGAIVDPFDAFLSSAIGWAIEHIGWLHEPLDALAGDPKEVVAQAQTWKNVAGELRAVGQGYAAQAAGVPGWEGTASAAYGHATADYARGLNAVAEQTERLSSVVLGSGAAVGTVRALVRDLIVEFLSWVAKKLMTAIVLAPFTGGTALAVGLGWVAWDAYLLANDIAGRISRLLDDLVDAGGVAQQLVIGMRHVSSEVAAAAPYVRDAARPVAEALDAAPSAEVVEGAKQFSGVKLDDPPAGR